MVRRLSVCIKRDVHALTFAGITYTVHRNFKHIILAAYEWLSENFQDGDVIYIFGKPLASVVFSVP
jgi:uncharacterized protein (DUF2235 family)